MVTIQDIFKFWGSRAEMAQDLGVPYQTISKWAQRKRIPSDWWGAVIDAAFVRGKHLNWALLAAANKPRKNSQPDEGARA